MSKITLSGNASGTGTFTIASPDSNTNRTLNLPDAAGTVATTAYVDAATAATDVQTFDASGTWNKPASGAMARIQVWGGGGGGARNTTTSVASGGGGGGYSEITVPLSSLASSETVTVGAAGVGRTASAGNGTSGGNSSFGAVVQAFGGGGGSTTADSSGGSPLFAGVVGGAATVTRPGLFMPATGTVISPFTGGFSSPSGANSDTLYGGAGGASTNSSANTTGGLSAYGGAGGAGGRSTSGINGTAPGGGGGGRNNSLDGGNGGAGRVIVTVW